MKLFLLIYLISINIINISSNKKIIDVVYIDQTNDYPTGCESVTTTMCLKYHNFDISVDEFINNYLELGDMYYKGNKLFAPDPFDKFVGSPYDDHSYGCYAPVIEKALKKIINTKNLNDVYEVINLTDVPMKTIIEEYIDKDLPVIFWATIDLVPTRKTTKWIVPETGKEFQWTASEHCLLLVGYDDEEKLYYFNDPWHNHGCIGYDMELVEQRHKEQFSNAVALVKKN